MFGGEPQMNPEEYERVRCELCHGSGHFWQVPDANGRPGPILRGNCPDCHGKGWLMVAKDPAESRDTPGEHPSATFDGQPPKMGSPDEAPADSADGRPDLPDMPGAPSAPSPPGGLSDS